MVSLERNIVGDASYSHTLPPLGEEIRGIQNPMNKFAGRKDRLSKNILSIDKIFENTL